MIRSLQTGGGGPHSDTNPTINSMLDSNLNNQNNGGNGGCSSSSSSSGTGNHNHYHLVHHQPQQHHSSNSFTQPNDKFRSVQGLYNTQTGRQV